MNLLLAGVTLVGGLGLSLGFMFLVFRFIEKDPPWQPGELKIEHKILYTAIATLVFWGVLLALAT